VADSGPEGRQALAAPLFTKLEVEGYTKMRYQLTPDAATLGLGAALPARLETGAQTGGFGRGERARADTPSPSLIISVTNVPSYVHRDWKTA
jgi:hypothetical protein